MSDSSPATITVRATGEARTQPDTAVLFVAIEAVRPSLAEAMARAETDAQAMFGALAELHLSPDAVTTVGMTARPHHDPRVSAEVSFAVGTQFNVRLPVDQGVGGAIARLVTAVGDGLQVHSVSFVASDVAALEAGARRNAVEQARAAAEQLAMAAGGRLGPLQSLSSGGSGGPMPFGSKFALHAASAAAAPIPVQPGETSVRVEVMAVYELELGS